MATKKSTIETDIISFTQQEIEQKRLDYPSFAIDGIEVERVFVKDSYIPLTFYYIVNGQKIDVRDIKGYQTLCGEHKEIEKEIDILWKERDRLNNYKEWEDKILIPYVKKCFKKYLVSTQETPTTFDLLTRLNSLIDDIELKMKDTSLTQNQKDAFWEARAKATSALLLIQTV
jgi:hypothetical protein